MKQVTNKKMLDAIKDNDGWIRYRCRLAEYNPSKCDELYQEALICLMMVRDDFDEESIINPIKWIKTVTGHTCSKHIRSEVRKNKSRGLDVARSDSQNLIKSEQKLELQAAINYMNKHFSDRDREMFSLYMLKETHKDIALILGMKAGSVANRILVLKEELNQFLNEGL
jgi:RNA polymerase sigma factor (sigma-70 family)